jgi:hypothetical protein
MAYRAVRVGMRALGFEIRAMSRAELDTAVAWAGREGWNPGRQDAAAFHAMDPLGFLAGVQDGRMVASISAVRYAPDYAFIGLFIVDRPWRGRGYGTRVWRAGMARLAAVSCVGLDGVPAQEGDYRRAGFATAYGNRRYGGAAPQGGSPDGLVDARTLPIGAILALDRAMFPAPRAAFLAQWIGLPGHRSLAALSDGRIAGLGIARPCAQGTKIGPLYADDRATAERIVRGLCATDGGPAFLDVPDVNAAAVAMAESFGWSVSFTAARMYRGPAPCVDLARLFGVTTLELG